MEEKTVAVSAYVLESLYKRLKVMADTERRSVSNMVVIAIDEFVRRSQPGGLPVSPYQSNIRTAIPPPERQVDLEEAIAAAVKRAPVKPAKHK